MKYAIFTADDLGLAKSINEGIQKACAEGVVTAATLIPTGEAFDDAALVARHLPFKSVGAHIALTETKSLLAGGRYCKNHKAFSLALLSGAIKEECIYAEAKAQIDLIKSRGLSIDQLTSHEHVHMLPRVLKIFIRLAKEYGIPAIRFPRRDRRAKPLSLRDNMRSYLLKGTETGMEKALTGSGIAHTDSFAGLLDAGRLDIRRISGIISHLKDGVTEVVTHPGFLSPAVLDRYKWHINCETELFALTDKSVRRSLDEHGVKLLTFAEFLKMKK